jgi:hypothetical protein
MTDAAHALAEELESHLRSGVVLGEAERAIISRHFADLEQQLRTQRLAYNRVQSIGQSLSENQRVLQGCLRRQRDGWVTRFNHNIIGLSWYHPIKNKSEPMTPAEIEAMNALD